jgi:hypothetical protein
MGPTVIEFQWRTGVRRSTLEGVNARWHRKSENRKSQGHKFYAFHFREVRNPIGERTVVLWTSRSHEKEVSRRELRSAESSIADRESGIREDSRLRQRKCRFPDREIPDRSKESVWRIFIGVRVFVRPDLVSAGLAITRGLISR